MLHRGCFILLACVFAVAVERVANSRPQECSAGEPAAKRVPQKVDMTNPSTADQGLVGYWKLIGDCRDHSGHDNHGVNHGVDLDSGRFNGRSAYIEVPASPSLKFGTGEFTVSAWIYTEKDLDDVVGDIIDMYDPAQRRGITLCVNSSGGGYQGQGSDRHVYFGIDNGRLGQWQDCGRPNLTSNYVSNSLTVFRGKLYAATTDAKDEKDWCHVYRYEGGQEWTDCGRVGDRRTTGVVPLVVHDGNLYAVTSTYDWTRVREGNYDPGRVYRYDGDMQWHDCGQPSDSRTMNCAASFKGKLYVGGGPQTWGVFEMQSEGHWIASQIFEQSGPRRCFPHPLGRYNGKLYVAWPGVHSFDGQQWTFAGLPISGVEDGMLQTHSLAVYQGQLCAGTWPEAKVARYLGGEDWQELGRVGADGTEVNALVVYNGKLYGGSIPRAEVCRLDGDGEWTSLVQFYSPQGWQPAVPGAANRQEVAEWSRVTSLTIHDGKLFASIGSCTSSVLDAPADVRGRVFSIEAGKCATYGDDLGPGWKHVAAVRDGGRLKIFVNGQPAAESSTFEPAHFDVTVDRPLRIGFGQLDYFCGRMSNVRLYNRALAAGELQDLAAEKPR